MQVDELGVGGGGGGVFLTKRLTRKGNLLRKLAKKIMRPSLSGDE
jgi:hypothetical protein